MNLQDARRNDKNRVKCVALTGVWSRVAHDRPVAAFAKHDMDSSVAITMRSAPLQTSQE